MKIEEIVSNDQLKEFMQLVLEENKRINLTAILEENEFVEKHLFDCLYLTEFIDFKDKEVMDLGSGAGFPGIPLAIVLKNTKFTLVEPIKKRCDFLNMVKDKLNLNNVVVLNKRVEDLDASYTEKFDYVTSRAVSKLNILLELSARYLKINGKMVFLKGLKYQDEIKESQNALKVLSLSYVNTVKAILPFSKESRFYIIIKKSDKTNICYPRIFSKIKKRPL